MSAPPGWYTDPGGSRQWRWWDGSRWSHHVAPMAPPHAPFVPTARSRVEGETRMAGWARTALVVYAVAAPLSAWMGVTVMDAVESMATFMTPGTVTVAPVEELPPGVAEMLVLQLLYQAVGLLQVGCVAAMAVWFYRSAVAAAALDLPARRSPGWAVGSWFIPVVNLWWPCQSSRELLPPGHAMRGRITLLWVVGIISGVLTLVGLVVVMVGDAPVAVAVAPTFVTALVLLAARGVVTAILREHEDLLAMRGSETAPA